MSGILEKRPGYFAHDKMATCRNGGLGDCMWLLVSAPDAVESDTCVFAERTRHGSVKQEAA